MYVVRILRISSILHISRKIKIILLDGTVQEAEILDFLHMSYDLTDGRIRPEYHMDETCQRTVPEAIIAFLESKDFEDAVRNAVSLGGDTDTLGAITGSIAEAFYGIPAVLIAECKSRIDKGLMTDVLDEFDHVLGRSMDTYSDEMDEIQANQMIEAAIDQYYEKQDSLGNILGLRKSMALCLLKRGKWWYNPIIDR